MGQAMKTILMMGLLSMCMACGGPEFLVDPGETATSEGVSDLAGDGAVPLADAPAAQDAPSAAPGVPDAGAPATSLDAGYVAILLPDAGEPDACVLIDQAAVCENNCNADFANDGCGHPFTCPPCPAPPPAADGSTCDVLECPPCAEDGAQCCHAGACGCTLYGDCL